MGDYDEDIQEIIQFAHSDLRARLFTSDPFADEETVLTEALAAWERACNTLERKVLPDDSGRIMTVVSNLFNLQPYLLMLIYFRSRTKLFHIVEE